MNRKHEQGCKKVEGHSLRRAERSVWVNPDPIGYHQRLKPQDNLLLLQHRRLDRPPLGLATLQPLHLAAHLHVLPLQPQVVFLGLVQRDPGVLQPLDPLLVSGSAGVKGDGEFGSFS